MGIRGSTIAWRFLETISEENTPRAYARLLNAIKGAVDEQGLNCSVSPLDAPVLESGLWARWRETLMTSPTSRGNVRPSFASGLMVEGTPWGHLLLRMTAIPHLAIFATDRRAPSDDDLAVRSRLAQSLLRDGEVDAGSAGTSEFIGGTWALYFYFKIRLLKVLRRAFMEVPYSARSVLVPPDRIFPQIGGQTANIGRIADRKAIVRSFLDRCDDVLVKSVGADELAAYLGVIGLPTGAFLSAQRRSIFGVPF